MTPTTAVKALADATAALTQPHDVTDVLARVVRDCAEVLSASAVGVLLLTPDSQLELLTATSHRIAELETFQAQHQAGPCVEAIKSGRSVSAVGVDQIAARWAEVGRAITDAGYVAVHAYPLRWQDHTLGALNVFHLEADGTTPERHLLGQAFADIATIVIVQTTELTVAQIDGRLRQALDARTIIEQAKGVLAYERNVDMAHAYDLLLDMVEPDTTLSGVASQVISNARRDPLPPAEASN
jgi:transcriptional regulator with GAF, ATPase, and Fis domain